MSDSQYSQEIRGVDPYRSKNAIATRDLSLQTIALTDDYFYQSLPL
jgi:hypothetical protein